MSKEFNLECYFDAIIVKEIEDAEENYGNIVVPDLGKDRNKKGTVVAVGPGKYTITGDFIKTVIKVGEKVILPTMGFSLLEHDGEEYMIGSENMVLAKIKE